MSSKYKIFDRSKLKVLPLSERESLIDTSIVAELKKRESYHASFDKVADSLLKACAANRAGILMIGAHVLRSGMQKYLFDLMESGVISCIAVNGACAIHDYELAVCGSTTESVAKYISNGQFGLWQETGNLNDIVKNGVLQGLGFGESVGKELVVSNAPHADISLFAKAYELGIPVTVHAGIGYDIIHEHPNCDGSAIGEASYTDFLIFTSELEKIEGGVIMNFGSAIMAPEIFLKALAMVRNIARQKECVISDFTTLVCDLHDLPENVCSEAPKNSAEYYFRPWKTMLVRTVADGGRSFYVRGFHADTIPQLWTAVRKRASKKRDR